MRKWGFLLKPTAYKPHNDQANFEREFLDFNPISEHDNYQSTAAESEPSDAEVDTTENQSPIGSASKINGSKVNTKTTTNTKQHSRRSRELSIDLPTCTQNLSSRIPSWGKYDIDSEELTDPPSSLE